MMNDLTEKLISTHKPRLAVIAYTTVMDNWNDCYLESHEINSEGQLMEGKPLKQETIQHIVDVFFDERQNAVAISGLIPFNLLRFELLPGGWYRMAWFRPAERRHLYFSEELHLKSGIAWVPALIYNTDGRELDVYAIEKDDRPDESTKFWQAPFHNVSGGSVCLGNAQVKKPTSKTYANIMKYWEDMFWLSEFSHLAGNENPTKTNLILLWKQLIKDKALKWDQLGELKPMAKMTLKSIL